MSFVVHYAMNKRYIDFSSSNVYTFKSLSCYRTLTMLVFLCLILHYTEELHVQDLEGLAVRAQNSDARAARHEGGKT